MDCCQVLIRYRWKKYLKRKEDERIAAEKKKKKATTKKSKKPKKKSKKSKGKSASIKSDPNETGRDTPVEGGDGDSDDPARSRVVVLEEEEDADINPSSDQLDTAQALESMRTEAITVLVKTGTESTTLQLASEEGGSRHGDASESGKNLKGDGDSSMESQGKLESKDQIVLEEPTNMDLELAAAKRKDANKSK